MNQPFNENDPPPDGTVGPALPLPLHKPIVTYILLASIIIIWLLMELYGFILFGSFGGSTSNRILIQFGANVGELILAGETWRLFTSMFLHIGLVHLLFNSYALFIFGLEMERLYGSDRYIVIYILAGLFGSLASFAWRGPTVLSAGASGAIFGIIGVNLAYFSLHRETLGSFARARMQSTIVIIAINLVLGFTTPGIDNLAHMGGLVAGFFLGYGLAPHYQVIDQYTAQPRVVDTVSLLNRWWVPTIAVLLLAGGTAAAITFWLNQ